MSPTAPGPAFSRRGLLAASAAGLAVLVSGCTSSGGTAAADPTERAQTDAMTAQVAVQEAVVGSYSAAAAADPALGAQVAELSAQATTQLTRLEAAAPSRRAAGSSAAPSAAGPPAGQSARAWLRAQVGAAADSHAAACVEQSGSRAALLGSIAAGLRGQAAQLA